MSQETQAKIEAANTPQCPICGTIPYGGGRCPECCYTGDKEDPPAATPPVDAKTADIRERARELLAALNGMESNQRYTTRGRHDAKLRLLEAALSSQVRKTDSPEITEAFATIDAIVELLTATMHPDARRLRDAGGVLREAVGVKGEGR